jgi:hypothetical protein
MLLQDRHYVTVVDDDRKLNNMVERGPCSYKKRITTRPAFRRRGALRTIDGPSRFLHNLFWHHT